MPWECYECTFVQEGSSSGRGPCIVCNHDNPLCIKVEVEDAGASPSPAPKITKTDVETKDLMSDVASLKAYAEAITESAVAVALAAAEESTADRGGEWCIYGSQHRGSHVEVVGIGELQRGRSCNKHNICGSQLCEGSYVCFHKTRFAWRGGDEEDVLEVFYLDSRIMGCKVGYLPKHLAARADRYEGLCARIVKIYSSD